MVRGRSLSKGADLCGRKHACGSWVQGSTFRRCPLIPRIASGMVHRHCSAWSPPLRDEDSQVQRGLRWAGLKPVRSAPWLGAVLVVLPRVLQQICCPSAHSPQALLLPCLPLVLTRFVLSAGSTLCSLPLARFTGDPGSPVQFHRDRCLDHDPPLANLSFCF